jgi:hypothetical protein
MAFNGEEELPLIAPFAKGKSPSIPLCKREIPFYPPLQKGGLGGFKVAFMPIEEEGLPC